MAITHTAGNATLEVNGKIDSADALPLIQKTLTAMHQLLALVVMRRTLVQQI